MSKGSLLGGSIAIALLCIAAPSSASAAGLVWGKPIKVTGQVLTSLSCPSTTFCAAGSYDDVYTSAAPSAQHPSWEAHQVVNSFPSAQKVPISSLSCANRHLCVATNEGGGNSELAISNHPLAHGSSTWTQISNSPNQLEDPLALSCPSTTLWVGSDTAGNVESFTNPGAKVGPWPTAQVDSTDLQCDGPNGSSDACAPYLGAISCPSTGLCIAVDFTGQLLTSTEPRDVSSWKPTARLTHYTQAPFFAGNFLQVYSYSSCPSTNFCAVVFDPTGQVFTTIDPTGPSSAWHATNIHDENIQAISCASTRLCVAVDSLGHAVTSIDPTAAHPRWTQTTIDRTNGPSKGYSPVQESLTGVACSSTQLCIAVDGYGDELIAKPAS
jgi:hypothetical protein